MATKKTSNTVQVQLRVATIGHKAGDVIEVESQEIADGLIANGHAVSIGDAEKQLEQEIKS